MFTTATRDSILGVFNATNFTGISPFCGLIKSITSFRTPTVVEADYTGYGTRPAITWAGAADTSPVGGRQRASSGLVTFPQNTGSSQDVIAWGIWGAATANTLSWIGMLDADPAIYGTMANTADTVTAFAHGLSVNQRVFYMAAPGALTPTGLSEGTAYFIGTATTDTFTLSTTTANANPVTVSGDGAGMFLPYTAVTIAAGATPEFASGALVIQL